MSVIQSNQIRHNYQWVILRGYVDRALGTLLKGERVALYKTTRVVVRKGFIDPYRRLVTSRDSKPHKRSSPLYAADVSCMTAALLAPPSDDSVSSALSIQVIL